MFTVRTYMYSPPASMEVLDLLTTVLGARSREISRNGSTVVDTALQWRISKHGLCSSLRAPKTRSKIYGLANIHPARQASFIENGYIYHSVSTVSLLAALARDIRL